MTAERVDSYQFWRERLDSISVGPPDLILAGTYIPAPSGRPPDEGNPSEMISWESVEDFLSDLDLFKDIEGETVLVLGVGLFAYSFKKRRWNACAIEGREEMTQKGVEFVEPGESFSFLFVDFDAPVTNENKNRIVKNLKKIGMEGTLFVSNASYYFVSKSLFCLDTLPAIYGKVILAFTAFPKSNPALEWAEEIGRDLIRAKNNEEEVEEICRFILENVGHFPEDGKRWSSCTVDLDLRYIARSLLNFPFLRVSRKGGYLRPPISIAEIEGWDENEIKRFGDFLEREICPPAQKSV